MDLGYELAKLTEQAEKRTRGKGFTKKEWDKYYPDYPKGYKTVKTRKELDKHFPGYLESLVKSSYEKDMKKEKNAAKQYIKDYYRDVWNKHINEGIKNGDYEYKPRLKSSQSGSGILSSVGDTAAELFISKGIPYLAKKGTEAGRYYASEFMRNPKLQNKAIDWGIKKATPVIQKVGSEALDQLSTKVRPNYKYKTDRMDLDADMYISVS